MIKFKFNNNFWGYFRFFYSILGNKLPLNLALNILISLLDTIGLVMFFPVLLLLLKESVTSEKHPLGKLHFIINILKSLGYELSIGSALFLLTILFTLKGLFKFIQYQNQVSLRQLFIKRLRLSFINNLGRLSYEGFVKLNSGRIHNVFTNESYRVYLSIDYYLFALQNIVMLVSYGMLGFWTNYQFGIFICLSGGLLYLIFKNILLATKNASIHISEMGNNFNGFLIESITYFKYLKSTNRITVFATKLKAIIDNTEALNKKMGIYNSMINSVKEPTIILLISAAILIQVKWFPGSITSISLALLIFYRGLSCFTAIQLSWQRFLQSVGAINEVSKLSIEIVNNKEVPTGKVFDSFQRKICMKEVSVSFGRNKILKGINLDFPKNHTTALIGKSGAGKTTIANLLCGLIKPDEGDILIDDVNLNTYDLNSFRNRIGYICQEPVVFNDNIFNNVTFWSDRTPDNLKRFWEAVSLSALSDFVESQPLKEDTQLGDNGLLISGGQKQRISFAREFYKRVEIIILDEATSSLDSESEQVIQENIEKLEGLFTVVVITHRLATVKMADFIYLVKNGDIESSGNFKTLMENSSTFRHMVDLQQV